MKTTIPHWKRPPADFFLPPGEVHVWRAELDGAGPQALAACRGVLSDEERQRADRFRFERHRRRFTLCRGILRRLLGRYLDATPAGIELVYGEHGKPAVGASPGGAGLEFNLAHSRALGLFAFAWGRALGVDLEYCREMPRALDLARRFFSFEEYAGILRLPPERRQEGFFRCWAGKEAFVKATGAGFSFPLNHFSVSTDPDTPCRLIRVAGAPQAPQAWSLTSFIPAASYTAVVAAAGRDANYRWWDADALWET